MADAYHHHNTQGQPQWSYGGGSNTEYYNQGPPANQDYPADSMYQHQHQPERYGYQDYPPEYSHPDGPPMEHREVQGSNHGQDRGFLEHIPFTAQHAQYEAQKHRHPLAFLFNKEGTKIALELVDTVDGGGDKLIPTAHDEDSFKFAYSISYQQDGSGAEVTGSPPPNFNADDEVQIGTWRVHPKGKKKLTFKFPWLTWSFDPQTEYWTSDVKLLGGEDDMNWIFTDESAGQGEGDKSHVDFTLRCVDMSDSERRLVSKVVLRAYTKMTVEIPVKIIASKQQLDELIVVSFAVMDWYRDQILNGTL